ncbi:MAG: hypothetical protein QW478_06780 [Candidatus Micrarchaeaceae archaeon]
MIPIENKDSQHMKGFVEIFTIDKKSNIKKLHSKSNLIVYLGREWLLSRIINYNNPNITPNSYDYISYLGIGIGGAPVTDPLNPIPPSNTDTQLAQQIPIVAGNPAYAGNGYYINFNNVTFLQDNLNLNSYLILRLDTLIDETMCNGYNINEAGLFTSNSNQPTLATEFFLFSRITYPTIAKGPDIAIQIIWYLYS